MTFLMLDRSKLPPDPLSDILSLLKPRNVACGAIDAGDACIAFPVGHGLKCQSVIAGDLWLAVDGVGGPLRLEAGDCFILPHGRSYRLASDLSLPAVDYRTVLAGRLPGDVTSWNGGGRVTIVSATFLVEERFSSLLLDILPPIVRVREDADRPMLRGLLQQMMQELRERQPGSRLIVEHLATMMLTQALRACSAQAGEHHVGWLFALSDQRIGGTLGALHAAPAHRWTVQALAERAGMSRTSFAVRFKSSVGSSPMDYLTRLRMLLASDRLLTSNDPINVVADALGYASESAFSAAFKRYSGCSPRRYANTAFHTEHEGCSTIDDTVTPR